MEFGNLRRLKAMSILAHISLTEKVVMAGTYGPTDAYMKEISQRMLSNLFII